MLDPSTLFSKIDVHGEDPLAEWTTLVGRAARYFTVNKTTDDNVKINTVLLVAGEEVDAIYEQLKGTNDSYQDVVDKISKHFNPTTSAQLNRYRFREVTQREGESFDEFVGRVREAAKLCNFSNREDEEIADQIVQRCRSTKLKSTFLSKKEAYPLKELLEQGRLEESVSKQIQQMNESIKVTATESKRIVDIESNVNEVRSTHKRSKFQNERQDSERKLQRDATSSSSRCYNCGGEYPHSAERKCPAKGAKCEHCKRRGHFARYCRKHVTSDLKSRLNKVDSRNCDDDDDSDEQRPNVWRIRAKNAINSVKALVLSIFALE